MKTTYIHSIWDTYFCTRINIGFSIVNEINNAPEFKVTDIDNDIKQAHQLNLRALCSFVDFTKDNDINWADICMYV